MLCLHCAHHCRQRLDVPSVHAKEIGNEGTGRRTPPTTIAILAAQPISSFVEEPNFRFAG
jgi:hypothetical protein